MPRPVMAEMPASFSVEPAAKHLCIPATIGELVARLSGAIPGFLARTTKHLFLQLGELVAQFAAREESRFLAASNILFELLERFSRVLSRRALRTSFLTFGVLARSLLRRQTPSIKSPSPSLRPLRHDAVHWLKSICLVRRRSVSADRLFIESVMLSAYKDRGAVRCRATRRPMVWIRLRSARRKPSLSASRIADQ